MADAAVVAEGDSVAEDGAPPDGSDDADWLAERGATATSSCSLTSVSRRLGSTVTASTTSTSPACVARASRGILGPTTLPTPTTATITAMKTSARGVVRVDRTSSGFHA